MNDDKRYLVVAADRTKGRIFTIFLGGFEDQGEFIKDNVHQKIKADNGRQGKVDRWVHGELIKHLKHVGEEAKKYMDRKTGEPIDGGIVIGGHRELLGDIMQALPNNLQKLVIGRFIAEPDRSLGELTELAKKAVS